MRVRAELEQVGYVELIAFYSLYHVDGEVGSGAFESAGDPDPHLDGRQRGRSFLACHPR